MCAGVLPREPGWTAWSLPNPAESVQLFQTVPDIASSHLCDGGTIVGGNLPMNFPDLAASKSTVFFKDAQEITGFHGNMLAHVAH